MKILLAFSVIAILVGGTYNFVIENVNTYKGIEQKILLRKLQNFQQNENSVSWNEILADVLVSKQIFRRNNLDNAMHKDIDEKPEVNILTKCFSEILFIYKTYIYDKLLKHYGSDIIDMGGRNNSINNTTVLNNNDNSDPKTEVELIEPRYHGKIDESTVQYDTGGVNDTTVISADSETNKTVSDSRSNETVANTENSSPNENTDSKKNHLLKACPDGMVMNEEEICVDPESSQYIFDIPPQCPKGSKRDRLGYCRPYFIVENKTNTDSEDAGKNETVIDSADTNATVAELEDSKRNKTVNCPEGFVADEHGQCIDLKSSKFIMYIPSQCPIGYRRDRLGYCRIIF